MEGEIRVWGDGGLGGCGGSNVGLGEKAARFQLLVCVLKRA